MPRSLLTGGAFRSRLFSELLAPDAAPPELAAGARLGVWRIERLLGRGGMSEVYLAHRDAEDFHQSVAIKVLTANLDAADLLRAERRLLGTLQHRGLATLIDGGELDGGKVWLAMEFVDGQPIDVYADAHSLSLISRIELMEQICGAVGHAHAHLLVHRDIKPSNVLVDRTGHARLIDFGIAVAVDTAASAQRWLTPGYAAPEQLRGDPLTTATDIFQLGRLLSALTSEGDLPDPPPRAVAEDLRRIVERASHPDPASRHESAAALAADLAALRAMRPLPNAGLRQRTRLWRLRHAWFSWVALPLLGLLATVATEAFRSSLREADERALALREEQVSSAIGGFFVDLFNEPVSADDTVTGVTALLDRGQRRLHQRPHAHPEIQAALLSQLAQANLQMERRDMAVELLQEAIAAQRKAGLNASLANSLATLARLKALAGDAEAGRQLAAEAGDLLSRDGRASRDRFLALTQLGEYHVNSLDSSEGEAVLRSALDVGVQRYGQSSPELYRTQRLLLELLRNQWRIDEAEPLTEKITAQCSRAFGADDPRCIVEQIHQQRVRALGGKPAEARNSLESLWAARHDWDGTLRHYRGHAVLYGLSGIHAIEGDRFSELAVLQSSLCELALAEGRGGLHWAIDRGGMATVLLELGAVEEALQLAREERRYFAGESTSQLSRAQAAVRMANIELAVSNSLAPPVQTELRDAVPRIRSYFGKHSYFAAEAELTLARLEAVRGDRNEALRLASSAARATPAGLHFYNPQLLAEVDTLRASLSEQPDERIALLARAESRLRASHGHGHVLAAEATLRRQHAEALAGRTIDLDAAVHAYKLHASQQVSSSPTLLDTRRWLEAAGAPTVAEVDGRPTPAVDPVCD